MPGWELKILEAEAGRLISLAAEDPEIRADLRSLAERILSETAAPGQGSAPGPAGRGDREPRGDRDATPPPALLPSGSGEPEEREPLHALTLGRSRPVPAGEGRPSAPSAPPSRVDDRPEAIEARCRVKAEAARRASMRFLAIRGGRDPAAEDEPADDEVAAWSGRFFDAMCWLEREEQGATADPSALDDLGGSFEALAEALAGARGGVGRGGRREKALRLVAEAQSAVRAALRPLRMPEDPDQIGAYEWVCRVAARERIYIARHLKADDLADPSRWRELLGRVEALGGGGPRARRRRAGIDRLRLALEEIPEGDAGEGSRDAVVGLVDRLVAEGLPPSDPELRGLLLPRIDDLPAGEDLPPGFRLVLREIDRALASLPPAEAAPAPPGPTPEVLEARRRLRGRGAVLIGGMVRPAAREALREALGLGSLEWIETREHQSIAGFEPAIARPEVAVVLLAIRWSSHSFGEIRAYCDRLGKPLVRLPGGYGVNQVAAQILGQCGDRLGGA